MIGVRDCCLCLLSASVVNMARDCRSLAPAYCWQRHFSASCSALAVKAAEAEVRHGPLSARPYVDKSVSPSIYAKRAQASLQWFDHWQADNTQLRSR